ncbi:hypothetical protein PR242_03690, partial [Metamycoplasma hyosynoviae]|nr:hypothetical protein [Metamycoplasma hyosynoviae]
MSKNSSLESIWNNSHIFLEYEYSGETKYNPSLFIINSLFKFLDNEDWITTFSSLKIIVYF